MESRYEDKEKSVIELIQIVSENGDLSDLAYILQKIIKKKEMMDFMQDLFLNKYI